MEMKKIDDMPETDKNPDNFWGCPEGQGLSQDL